MISAERFRQVAPWSGDLTAAEIARARTGVFERTYRAGECVIANGDRFDYWTGVVTGLVKVGMVSRDGKAITFAGLTAGSWFGEGSVLKNETRRYDAIALRNSQMALMERATFDWLMTNSVGFNRALVAMLNERLGQFMALVDYGRRLDATARLARCIASLFNPLLYPTLQPRLEITQEELGALSGMSRQNANRCLKTLEGEGLLCLDYGGVTVLELDRLRDYGE